MWEEEREVGGGIRGSEEGVGGGIRGSEEGVGGGNGDGNDYVTI